MNPPLHLSSWTLQAIRPTLANYERQETTTRLIMRPRKPISYCVDDGIGLGKLKRRLESSNLADLVAFDFELCLLESLRGEISTTNQAACIFHARNL